MDFPKLCKTASIVLLILCVIGAFPLASSMSKTIGLEPTTDGVKYATVLITTWVSGFLLFIIIYGLGEIIKHLELGNSRLFHILENQKQPPTNR